jgi:hypothetical protein
MFGAKKASSACLYVKSAAVAKNVSERERERERERETERQREREETNKGNRKKECVKK